MNNINTTIFEYIKHAIQNNVHIPQYYQAYTEFSYIS